MGDEAPTKKAKPPRNREVCHFLVHEDFFIHRHFIPYFVLYLTMTSCSYRGEYKKKIALFVTKNVTINFFECKHMKWVCVGALHLCTFLVTESHLVLPFSWLLWSGINLFIQLMAHKFILSMATWHLPKWSGITWQNQTKTKLKYTDFVNIFFIFLRSIVVMMV